MENEDVYGGVNQEQACGKENCRQRLGDQFDLKEFHNLVLKDGAMPLDILEQRVDKYILSKNK